MVSYSSGMSADRRVLVDTDDAAQPRRANRLPNGDCPMSPIDAAATATDLPDVIHEGLGYSRVLAGIVFTAHSQPEHPDAELLELGRRWLDVRQEAFDFDRSMRITSSPAAHVGEAWRDIKERERGFADAIAAVSARTLAGLAVKARLLVCADERRHVDDANAAVSQGAPEREQEGLIGVLISDIFRLAQEQSR